MKYSRNAVYTSVRNAVKTAYPSAYVTGVIAAVPTKSPAVMIQEAGKFHNQEAVTLSGLQPVYTSTFEAHVFSNLQNTGMTECYNIMNTVTEAFVKIGYRLILQTVTENGEDNKYRLVARFRRVTGVNDEMPE
jgi:hypothetical protein